MTVGYRNVCLAMIFAINVLDLQIETVLLANLTTPCLIRLFVSLRAVNLGSFSMSRPHSVRNASFHAHNARKMHRIVLCVWITTHMIQRGYVFSVPI
jgi:hypothetical protein